ncbi:hypothetical protein GCM10025771_07590 [Niveibacterium umoris]|uniref:Putative membrane protein YfcA n=1 Tax=Niveibacterium umoris TaxID=1193620 RepID=A0A840BMF7_9RHOO|nr:MerC domain-containing protein [Niveibacterium umoris]MBB4013694.1 putative membrane protein YfcA [Niveibacterium umoris]
MSAHHGHDHPPRSAWDKLGIFASAACLVHCLALPLLIPLLPALALIPHTGVHALLLVPVVLLSLLALLPGYRRHRSRYVGVAAIAGVSLCSIAVGAEALFHIESLDVPFTVAGGLLLVSAHWVNLRRMRSQTDLQACPA